MASGSNQIPWPENYTELDATFDPSTFQRGLTLDDVINKALVLLNVCTISLGGMNVLLVVVIMTSSTLYSATSALLCGVLVSNACYILRLAHSMQLYVEINALTCTALLTAETWGKLSISLYTTALLAYSYLHTKARRLHRGHEAGAQHWPKVVTTMLVGCSLVAVAGTLPVVLQAKVEDSRPRDAKEKPMD